MKQIIGLVVPNGSSMTELSIARERFDSVVSLENPGVVFSPDLRHDLEEPQ